MDPHHDWLGLSEVHVLGEHVQVQAVLRPKDAVKDLGKGQGLDTLQVIRKWVIYNVISYVLTAILINLFYLKVASIPLKFLLLC